jgi:hypothetical protein
MPCNTVYVALSPAPGPKGSPLSLLLYNTQNTSPRHAEPGHRPGATSLPRRVRKAPLAATHVRPPARPELMRRVLDGLKRL